MNKTVLITGASRGIGYALAEAFSKGGYTVYANYNKTIGTLFDLSEKLLKEGFKLVSLHADVSKAEEVKKMFSKAGKIDILINNAGISQSKLFTEITEADWDNMMDVNLKSVYLCTKCAAEKMILNKSGCVINISSVWGVTGGSCEVHYSAAKAGIIGFTKALAKELGPSKIRVNCIAPGLIETGMNSALSKEDKDLFISQTALQTTGKPEDIVKAALFLAENQFITGEVLNVNGGYFI